jgi:dGTPase
MKNNSVVELAPYAAKDETSLGRVHSEPSSENRSVYQRDRDRIIHSAAWRRLQYKTQVFMNHEGDMFRTRLSHSLEVAQISRTCARSLRLNEDLAETISLAHDLGHTPFGHAGQDELDACMEPYGGFEHNLQSLRVVDVLEEPYIGFQGLNLTFESREGILKHCSANNAKKLGDVGKRFLEKTRPSLEAQLTNLADEIAYNNHDVDDGVRSGLISVDGLREVALFGRHAAAVNKDHPGLHPRKSLAEIVRRMINELVTDLTTTSTEIIRQCDPKSIDDVRHSREMIRFSDGMRKDATELKQFLRKNLYDHYTVKRMRFKGQKVIRDLFDAFFNNSEMLPEEYRAKDEMERARKVADYIAGMTDRYAYKEYLKLFQISCE